MEQAKIARFARVINDVLENGEHLPPRMLETLYRLVVDGLDVNQVADRMGTATKTVESQMNLASIRLRYFNRRWMRDDLYRRYVRYEVVDEILAGVSQEASAAT